MSRQQSFNYQTFLDYSSVGNMQERKAIVQAIQHWQPIKKGTSIVSEAYRCAINDVVADEKINQFIQNQPHLKPQVITKLIEALEAIQLTIAHTLTFEEEKQRCRQFESIPNNETIHQRLLNTSEVLTTEDIKSYIAKEETLNNQPKLNQDNALKALHQKMIKHWSKLFKATKKESSQSDLAIKLKAQGIKDSTEKEEKLLNGFKSLTLEGFKDKMESYPYFKRFLKQHYPKDYIVIHYERQFKKIMETDLEVDVKKRAKLRKDFHKAWVEKINIEILSKQIQRIDKERKEAIQALYSKIDDIYEILKLLQPFVYDTTNFGRLWDLSLSDIRATDLSLLQDYAKLLERNKDLIELAHALGRFRLAEAAYEKEIIANAVQQSKPVINAYGKSELVGITESDDLNHILPTELALFSDQSTENIFFKRFAEKKLQTFNLIDKSSENYTSIKEEEQSKKVNKDKGPIIIAVDTSGSMTGEPEKLAKIIAFAITKIAVSNNRKAYLITFSTRMRTIELTNFQNSLPDLIDFLEMTFSGGTDPGIAVNEAIRKMKDETYQNADLLVVTDGIFYDINHRTSSQMITLKDKGNKFNVLIIGSSPNQNALTDFDNVWYYKEDDSIKRLVEQIKQLNT